MKFNHKISKLLFLLLLCSSFVLKAQQVNSPFGQNRLQYENKKWFRYTANNVAINYAKEDVELAKYALAVAEKDYVELVGLFEHQLNKRIELIIHSDYSDYRQSNIGLERHLTNHGGVTNFLSPKFEIYFTGDHQELRRQIRRGIAEMLIKKILFGTNLQEIVQNSVLMNFPEWFLLGVVEYSTHPWNTQKDDELRDILLMGKYADFLSFASDYPQLAGQSLFHFLSIEYGKNTISNLIYLTRINRSIQSGFLYSFGENFFHIANVKWFNYYSKRYNKDNQRRLYPSKGEILLKTKYNNHITQMRLSPNNKQFAYANFKQGKYNILLQSTENDNQETQVLFKDGIKIRSGLKDYNYPLIRWNKRSDALAVIYEKKGKIYFRTQTLDKKKATEVKIKGIERITSFDIVNSSSFYFTGIKNGQSDLFLYKNGKVSQLSNDFWDETEVIIAQFQGYKGLIFSSNRPDNKLKKQGFNYKLGMTYNDLFFLSTEGRVDSLIQLTFSPLSNESNIEQINDRQFSYLSDMNGIQNRYLASIDSVLMQERRCLVMNSDSLLCLNMEEAYKHLFYDSFYIDSIYRIAGLSSANTNYSRGIQQQSIRGKKVLDLFLKNGQYQLFYRDLHLERKLEVLSPTTFNLLLQPRKKQKPLQNNQIVNEQSMNPVNSPKDSSSLNIDNYEFQFDDSLPNKENISPSVDSGEIDINDYVFQNDFDTLIDPKETLNPSDPKELEEINTPTLLIENPDGSIQSQAPEKVATTTISKPQSQLVQWDPKYNRAYKNLFRFDQFTFQLDNTPMYNNMDMFLGGYYQFTPLSLHLKTGFKDIFEHFYVELGARVPLSFNGAEYYINIENRKGPIDQKYSLYRRNRVDPVYLVDSLGQILAEVNAKNIKYLIQTELRYPFSRYSAIQANIAFQSEKLAVIADNDQTLNIPNYNEHRVRLGLQYTFDNSKEIYINGRIGSRLNAYVDFFKPFSSMYINDELEIDANKGLTTAIGFDARHYHSFDQKTIFAFRFAMASSFGKEKILYSMGSVENWIVSKENAQNPFIALPDANDFGLQTLAAPIRGFKNNIRNGNSFGVLNAEVRIPVSKYLYRYPPRNTLVRNLQLVGFFDMGTAWQGLSPFSRDNPLNTTIVDQSGVGQVTPVRVKVNYFRDPILMSYGFGIRTVVLGHYFKLDYAWGIETGQIQNPMLHLSIGTDF